MPKIGLITDLHIGSKGNAFGIDTYNNFKNLLKEMKKWKLDHLVVAGDLCFQEPEKEVYEKIKKDLDNYKISYSIIVGNHDEASWMAETFDLHQSYHANTNEIYYIKEIGGIQSLFLDTQKGDISETQLTWLQDHINEIQSDQIYIFMHYPPVFGGVPHMDGKYALNNKELVQDILNKSNKMINIFTGHFHVEKTISMGWINVFITPSAFVQIDQQSTPFIADHRNIAYRIIDIENDALLTSVHYLF